MWGDIILWWSWRMSRISSGIDNPLTDLPGWIESFFASLQASSFPSILYIIWMQAPHETRMTYKCSLSLWPGSSCDGVIWIINVFTRTKTASFFPLFLVLWFVVICKTPFPRPHRLSSRRNHFVHSHLHTSYIYSFVLLWVHFGVWHDRRGQWQHHLLTRGFTLHRAAVTPFLKSCDDRYRSLNSISVTCVCPNLSNMSWLLTFWQLTLVLKLGSLNMWNPPSLFFFNTVLMRSNLLPPVWSLIFICQFVWRSQRLSQ